MRHAKLKTTRATAATIERWVKTGKKRLRKKYSGATVTACRILNRREIPIVGERGGKWGLLFHVKLSYGAGYLRARGEPTLGWYGDWHRTSAIGVPLHCLADLRRWIKTHVAGFVSLRSQNEHFGTTPYVLKCASRSSESLRALRDRGRNRRASTKTASWAPVET